MSIRIAAWSVVLGLGGCASAPPPVPLAAAPAPQARPFCVQETGSRLRPLPGRCLPGRVVTREELYHTGAVGMGAALSRLIVR